MLTNVDGLSGLTSVGGYLDIVANTTLNGFCGLYRLIKSNGPTGNYTVSGNAIDPLQADIINGGPCPGIPVPTLSEWGLIFLALFLLAFGVVAVEQKSLALAGSPVAFRQQGFSVDAKRWLNLWLASMVLVSGVFGLAVVFAGYEMTAADFCCTPLAAAVGAYILAKLR